jgi:protein O-mannosyl-transferase
MRKEERALRAALGFLACAAAAPVYQHAVDLPFVFDDLTTVLLNPSLVDLGDVRAVLFHDPPRAVVNVSYAMDRVFWGFSSFGYHVTSFILHIIVVGLFYGWCTRVLADGLARLRPKGATARQLPGADNGLTQRVEWPAFFAAAAFALHPLIGGTVVYVSARSELLCALGVLAALTFARRAIVTSSVFAGIAAAAFGALAAASSGAAVALPVVILVYDVWVLKAPGWKGRVWRAYLPAMVAIAILAAWDLRLVLSADRVPARGVATNLLTEAIVIWRYLGLLVVPAGQSIVHQVRWVTSAADPIGLLALAGIAAAIVAAIRFRHAAPVAAFGTIWFFATLAATSVVPLRDAMAEHRTYVPAAGLLFAAASLLARPLSTRRTARLAAIAVLAALSVLTYARHTVWSEPLELWEEAVRRSPDAWQARLGHAEILREIGRCERAIPEYETTLRLNPDQGDAVAGLKHCRTGTN